MAHKCAGCRSLAAQSNDRRVPAFFESVVYPGTHRPQLRFYVCLGCDSQWVWREDERRWLTVDGLLAEAREAETALSLAA